MFLRNLAEFQTEHFRGWAGFIPAITRGELKRGAENGRFGVWRTGCRLAAFSFESTGTGSKETENA